MAASLNKVMLMGNLGANPELKYLPSGQAVCEMRLATNDVWTDKQGQKQERTEWHRVVVWGKTAENCAQYLQKGRPVFVEGRIQTRSWDDKEGNKRYMTEVVAERVLFLGGGERGEGRPSGPPAGMGQGAPASPPRRSDEAPPPVDFGPPGPTGEEDVPF